MIIDVTQEDIDQGVRGNCLRCPVARALRRTTGAAWIVDGDALFRLDFGQSVVIPAEVAEFIRRFDGSRGNAVAPFSFTIPEGES